VRFADTTNKDISSIGKASVWAQVREYTPILFLLSDCVSLGRVQLDIGDDSEEEAEEASAPAPASSAAAAGAAARPVAGAKASSASPAAAAPSAPTSVSAPAPAEALPLLEGAGLLLEDDKDVTAAARSLINVRCALGRGSVSVV
jgi:hypothetical protein